MSSQTLSLAEGARRADLDQIIEPSAVQASTAGDLFAIVDAVQGSSALRRALTDPGSEPAAKTGVVDQLFSGKVSPQALDVLRAAVGMRWGTVSAFIGALERQGVRAALCSALAAGRLDEVTDELFRFNRIVQATPALQSALADASTPLAGREALLADLLGGKSAAETLQLAQRAVAQSSRTFAHAVDATLATAAELRNRAVAKVTVARMLDQTQEARLRAALTRTAGRPVDLQIDVDPHVLGGVRVALGDSVYEGTVSQKLTDLQRHFG